MVSLRDDVIPGTQHGSPLLAEFTFSNKKPEFFLLPCHVKTERI